MPCSPCCAYSDHKLRRGVPVRLPPGIPPGLPSPRKSERPGMNGRRRPGRALLTIVLGPQA